jgi:hypothetical protein
LKNIPSEKWLYDIIGNSRDTDPIQYRLLSWRAYLYNLNGVGFWNYSQSPRGNNDFNQGYINGRQDYSVIYNDLKGNIMPSMRWESFYLGLVDYSKLKLLEKKKGRTFVTGLVISMLGDFSLKNRAEIFNSLNRELSSN